MFGMMITRRCFHVDKARMAVTKSSFLAKLRKSTGYSVSNCKKALEMFPGNVQKAEEWLHEEAKSKGWAKWAKIQNRTAAQGLIGVCSRDNIGVMVEVNCETDFVSRNLEFQEFVAKMLSGCMSYAANLNIESDVAKEVLEESQLNAVRCETSTLGELLIAAAFKFNEKTVAKRAVCFKVSNDVSLSSLSHPVTACPSLNGASIGKYGVLLASKKNKLDATDYANIIATEDANIITTEDANIITTEDANITTEDANRIELNMCQHIIGMNPLSLGQLTDKDVAKFSKKNSSTDVASNEIEQNIQSEKVEYSDAASNKILEQNIQSEKVEYPDGASNEQLQQNSESEKVEDSDNVPEGQEEIETALKDSNETQLLFQPFLLDPTVTVGETVFKSGLEVLAFERFECGESAEEQQPEAALASN